ncbi:serine hydrolase [Ensifer sesbaniae]|jgi:CubicO group peptidase (beta-lactamase class C family)|uniref:serine hydrolase n=1 Tax=Ensifer sesbaniae TaxID=1214071 RepID=UPI00200122B1|nr:serine hydrolase [Ensifer sesbaniae]
MRTFFLNWIIVMTLGTTAHAGSPSTTPTDAEILDILTDRIDKQQQSVGIVVGITDANGRRIVAHGHPAKGDPRPVDGHTVFEIGSVTKVFTALLLADAVERGTLGLDTPVSTLLPPGVTMPEDKQAPITLADLATHMSGLPRLPSNLAPADVTNPYADYNTSKLYGFLSTHKPLRRPGVEHEYSNLGAGLLGHVLALKAGLSYEDLVERRIARPLGLEDTAITPQPDWSERRATGHDAALEPVRDWDLNALQGAGALRSTADDLLIFLEAAMGRTPSPLASAFATLLATRQPLGEGAGEQALGWVISGKGDAQVIWHNGGTGGYRSFVGYRPSTGIGVVALSNTSTEVGVDDIGQHLLNRTVPLAPATVQRTAITVDPATYDAYLGTYRLAPGFDLTIFRDGNRLFAQATDQDRLEILPEAEHRFFAKLIDAQISFTLNGTRAESLTLHQGGRDSPAPRVEK